MISCDLIIAGSFIRDQSMIWKAIASAPEYDYLSKNILIDGCPMNRPEAEKRSHLKYIKNLKLDFPDFNVISFEENIYLRSMIQEFEAVSDGDYALVIQDDIILQDKINLEEIFDECLAKDIGWLSFPNRQLHRSNELFDFFAPSLVDPVIPSHGVGERAFIVERECLQGIIKSFKGRQTKKESKSISAIYAWKKLSKDWLSGSDKYKSEYWNHWKAYVHLDITHHHQQGKRA